VNLRSEIRAAIDEVAPPAPALQRDVVAFVFSQGKPRTNRAVSHPSHLALGMRRAGSLVAIALVMLLLATLFVGGRLWRDWNGQQQSLATQAKVAQLRERPLHLPSVAPGAVCPESPFLTDDVGFPLGYGAGPLYASGSGARFVTPSGTYFDTGYGLGYFDLHPEFHPPVADVVLIRERDLVTNQTVVFGSPPFENFWSGHVKPEYPSQVSMPSGIEVRTDTVVGVPVHFYSDLVLDPARPWWETMEGLPKGSSGCIGIQADGFLIDGSRFTEVIVVRHDM
jgi:hypothetical protein